MRSSPVFGSQFSPAQHYRKLCCSFGRITNFTNASKAFQRLTEVHRSPWMWYIQHGSCSRSATKRAAVRFPSQPPVSVEIEASGSAYSRFSLASHIRGFWNKFNLCMVKHVLFQAQGLFYAYWRLVQADKQLHMLFCLSRHPACDNCCNRHIFMSKIGLTSARIGSCNRMRRSACIIEMATHRIAQHNVVWCYTIELVCVCVCALQVFMAFSTTWLTSTSVRLFAPLLSL